jgi:site-specific recombinase XerD
MVTKITTAAGIPRHIRPHSLRHAVHFLTAYVVGV